MKKFPKYQSDVWSVCPKSGRCHLSHCWEKEQMEMDTVPASSLACVFPFAVLRDPPQWPWRGSGTRTSLCTPGSLHRGAGMCLAMHRSARPCHAAATQALLPRSHSSTPVRSVNS